MNREKRRGGPYETILGITLGFIILFLIFQKMWLAWLAVLIGLPCLFSSAVAGRVQSAWSYITRALGWVNSRILLTLIFFLILTPIALFRRLLNGNRELNLKNDKDSLFVVRDHQYEGKDLKNPW